MNFAWTIVYDYGFIILSMGAILAITIGLVRLVNLFTRRLDRKLEKTLERQSPKPHVEVPDFKIDATHYRFFKHLLIGLIYLVGGCLALSMIPSFKSVAYSVLAGSGIASVLMTSLASKETLSNVLGGLFIEIFRPFEIGNHIKVGDREGHVKDITLSHTIIKTSEQNHIMIPNALINSQSIENVTLPKEKICNPFDVYVSYDADLEKALEVIRVILELHPLLLDRRTTEEKASGDALVEVNVEKLERAVVHLRAWIWAKNEADVYKIKCDSFRQVKKSFDAQRIPFPKVKHTSNKELSL